MEKKMNRNASGLSRRNFIKTSAVVSLAALGTGASRVFAAGSDKIRVGLVGCGGRGRHDSTNLLKADDNIELVAMGDMFEDRVKGLAGRLMRQFPDKVKVTPDKCFVGLDAYKKVLESDIDMVMLIETPHFRPQHLRSCGSRQAHLYGKTRRR